MKRSLVAVLAGALVAAGAPAKPAQPRARVRVAKPGRVAARPPAAVDELIVEFAPRVSRRKGRRLLAARGAELGEPINGTKLSVVELRPGGDPARAARRYTRMRFVRRAEPNLLRFVAQAPPKPPDDEHFKQLWGLDNRGQQHLLANPPPSSAAGTADVDMDVPEAWTMQTGSPETVIAVLDSGVDVTHPDLAGSLWTNPGEIPDNGLDDDANGYVDDVHGWDFGDEDATLVETDTATDGYDHGTHVAGTIAAQMNNKIGVAGVCPGCKLMVLKGFRRLDVNGDGQFELVMTVADEIEALAYAQRMGADIVNGSFAAASYSKEERLVFEQLGAAGILAVLAAGNSNADNDLLLFEGATGGAVATSPMYPASYDLPGILSVGASNHHDEYAYDTGCALQFGKRSLCAFTHWGSDSVDIVAPGTDIFSTVPGGYGTKVGTSMAAPHVAGVAGLVESMHPEYAAAETKNAILNSADRPPSLNLLYAFEGAPVEGSFTKTNGRANALGALGASPVDALPPSDGTIGGAVRLRKEVESDVAWPEDVNDVYKKRLRKGSRYKVVLVRHDEGDLDLMIYKPKARDIWEYEPFCVTLGPPCGAVLARSATLNRREKVEFKARANRDYYLHVASYFTTTTYKLKVERLTRPKKRSRKR